MDRTIRTRARETTLRSRWPTTARPPRWHAEVTARSGAPAMRPAAHIRHTGVAHSPPGARSLLRAGPQRPSVLRDPRRAGSRVPVVSGPRRAARTGARRRVLPPPGTRWLAVLQRSRGRPSWTGAPGGVRRRRSTRPWVRVLRALPFGMRLWVDLFRRPRSTKNDFRRVRSTTGLVERCSKFPSKAAR